MKGTQEYVLHMVVPTKRGNYIKSNCLDYNAVNAPEVDD
jgi:hypothetical protein